MTETRSPVTDLRARNKVAKTAVAEAQTGAAGATGASLDVGQIMELIPHRPPFLLIERVENVVPDVSAVGVKNVSIGEGFFQGHFPEKPIMPGVLIIECMAQTAAVLVVRTLGHDARGKLVYFMSIDATRFRRPVVPGDRLLLHVAKLRSRKNVWKFEGVATVDGQRVAEATYSAIIMDRE